MGGSGYLWQFPLPSRCGNSCGMHTAGISAGDNSPMKHPAEVTEAELLAHLHRRDKDFTKTQLAYARRSRLLPAPRQRSLGRGRGTETVYPAGAIEHLEALVDARRKYRTNERVAWALWWRGHQIHEDLVRPLLKQQASGLDCEIHKLRLVLNEQTDPDLSAQWQRWLYEDGLVPIADPALRQMRKRVGSARFPTLLRVIAEVVRGTFEGFSQDPVFAYDNDQHVPEEAKILEKALGLARARKDRLLNVPPWLAGTVETDLKQIAELFRSQSFSQQVDRVSFQELNLARSEFERFARVITAFAALTERIWGPHAFGVSVIAQQLRCDIPEHQQIVFLSWLKVMGVKEVRAGATAFLKLEGAAREMEENLRMLSALAREVGPLRHLLAPRRIRLAMRNSVSLERFTNDLDRVYILHKRAVESALRALSRGPNSDHVLRSSSQEMS